MYVVLVALAVYGLIRGAPSLRDTYLADYLRQGLSKDVAEARANIACGVGR